MPGLAAGARSAGRGRHRREAHQALTALYTQHHRALFRLAVLLTGDLAAAEQIAEDAFAGMHGARRHLRDSDRALAYLRRAVVSRTRC